MKSLPLLFMGSPPAAVTVLKALIDGGHEVRAVVTQPDKPAGRGQHLTPPAVKTFALSKGLRTFQPSQLKDPQFIKDLRTFSPQVIIVVAYGRILPDEILALAPRGAWNVHFSLLPKYRGAACVASAIRNGEKETGVTLMRMVKKLDAGPILKQKKTLIDSIETAGALEERLALLGAELVLEGLKDLEQGDLGEIVQNEAEASYAASLKKEEGKINWNQPAQTLYNHIRAMIPWPVAYTLIDNQRLKIYGAKRVEEETGDRKQETGGGKITKISEKGIEVSCREGKILLTEVQPPSKRKMSAWEFIQGHKTLISVGKEFS